MMKQKVDMTVTTGIQTTVEKGALEDPSTTVLFIRHMMVLDIKTPTDKSNITISWCEFFPEGKYDLAEVNETGKLRVQTEGREVLPEALSRGTLEQFYFAFRMAVGSIVTQEEPLPLLLDETFAMYDDDRLRQTLRLLAANGSQTILFTCQRREQKLLEELGIAYHMIEL